MDADTMLLWMFVLAVTAGVGLVSLMIFKPNRETDEEHKNGKGSSYVLY